MTALSPRTREPVFASMAEALTASIDGTLIPIDRIAADRPFYSGEHNRHGVNPQVIASLDGTIQWVSPHRAGRLAKAIHVLQNYEVAAG